MKNAVFVFVVLVLVVLVAVLIGFTVGPSCPNCNQLGTPFPTLEWELMEE